MTAMPLADEPSAPAPAGAGRPAVAQAGTGSADARQARLAASVARLKRRSSGIQTDRLLLLAGSILLPSGLIVILLGWYGASHTSYAFEQTPYIISGGLLGAGMTVAGGFLYFGYWLTRLVQEGRRQRVELTELLLRLDNRMAVLEGVATGTLPGAAAMVPGAAGAAGAVNGGPAPSALVATATGTLVHRADCPLVAGKTDLQPVSDDAGERRGCKVCQPFGSLDHATLG